MAQEDEEDEGIVGSSHAENGKRDHWAKNPCAHYITLGCISTVQKTPKI
jgi:hypothetical protein